MNSSLFFAAYGDRTVGEVKRSLALRESLLGFTLRAQGLSATELKTAFAEAFPA